MLSDDSRAPSKDPVALNGAPVEAEAIQGTPTFRVIEVVEMSKRQQSIVQNIAVQMDTKEPHGIVDGKINGQGVLRKILLLL